MKSKTTRFKKRTILLIILSLLLITLFLMRYFFPSFHSEVHHGVEFYENESYMNFGIGFNRYGKIASDYIPKYKDICENANHLDFYYKDSSFGVHKYVIIAAGAIYDPDIYVAKRDEILKLGTDFGDDYILQNANLRQYRLVDTKSRINGEKLYYIIGCSDTDNTIMYFVYIDNKALIDEVYPIFEDTALIYTQFWQNLHPTTTLNESLSPEIN
ncbi:MAG: hypothetical protein E7653_02080 [Ruminococcaceae bacterium]|nr:hypothetical protein [Oscillospiraceae bacterium]